MINLSETAPSHTHLLFRLTLEWGVFKHIFEISSRKVKTLKKPFLVDSSWFQWVDCSSNFWDFDTVRVAAELIINHFAILNCATICDFEQKMNVQVVGNGAYSSSIACWCHSWAKKRLNWLYSTNFMPAQITYRNRLFFCLSQLNISFSFLLF